MQIIKNKIFTLFTLLFLLVFGGFTTEVWSATATLTSNGLAHTGPTSVTSNGVTFSVNDKFNTNLTSDYYFIYSGQTGEVSWTVPEGYSVAVTGVSIHARNASYSYWEGWSRKTAAGTGYIHTSLKSTNKKVCQSTSYGDYGYSSSANSDYFGASGLPNDGKLYFYAENAEFRIQSLTFTYTKTANTYTIAFNGNGSTAGSTASVGATYDQNVTLAANGYRKHQYIVSYNVDGGVAINPDSTLYSFQGWNTKSDGKGTNYSEGQTLTKPNFTSTQGATVTLYAKWSTSVASTSITLPTPEKSGYSFDGWYDGETRVGGAGASYTPSKNVTLKAKWSLRYTPQFTFIGSKTDLKVGESLSNVFSFEHVPNPVPSYNIVSIDAMQDANHKGKVIEYSDNTIYARNAGVVKLVINQALTGEVYEGHSDTVTITVTKHETSFSGSAYTFMVDGTQIADYTYTNTSASEPTNNSANDFYYTIDEINYTNQAKNKKYNSLDSLVRFTPGTKEIKALNAGTGKITLHQKETYKYTGATASYNVNIYKYNSVFANVDDKGVKVDADVASSYTLTYTKPDNAYIGAANHLAGTPVLNASESSFYYTLAQNVTTSHTEGSPDASLAITYNAAYKTATGNNAGTGTIHFYQPETYKYNPADEDFVVTVTKNTNALTCDWAGWTKTLNFDRGSYVNISSTYSGESALMSLTPIVVTQTEGDSIATFWPDSTTTDDPNGDAVYASCYIGNATWDVTQAENYKYLPADKQVLTVYVRKNPDAGCYLIDTPEDKNDKPVSEIGQIYLGGVGDVLTFQMRWKGTQAGNDAILYTSPDGTNWDNGQGISANAFTIFSSYDSDGNSKTINNLPAGTRYIRFEKDGSDDPYVRNIKVTRKQWFKLTDNGGKEYAAPANILNMPVNELGGNSQTATFKVDYSVCDVDYIKLVSNHPHITFGNTNDTTYKFASEGEGTQTITLKYTCDTTETIDATITVYTPYDNKTLLVHAETEKMTQSIIWHEGYNTNPLTLPVGIATDTAAHASSNLPVIYTTNNDEVVRIYTTGSGKSAFEIINNGDAKLAATQIGDKDYKYVSDTIDIKATNKKIQVIVWGQDLTHLRIGDEPVVLTAKVMVMNEGVLEDSEERTNLLNFVVENSSVVSWDGSILTMGNAGKTSITASVPGDEDYEAVSTTMPIEVRDPAVGCEDMTLPFTATFGRYNNVDEGYADNGDYVLYFGHENLIHGATDFPELSVTFTIDHTKGVPAQLTFSHKGTKYANVIYSGKIDVRISDDGTNWSEIKWSEKPTVGVYKIATIPLQRTTKYVKFTRPQGGTGYHHIGNVTITPAQYLEAEDVVDFGNVEVGSIATKSDVSFNYSYLKGENIEISSDTSVITVTQNINVECGSFGSKLFTITCAPTQAGTIDTHITLRESISGLTETIRVTANVTKGSQTITWNPERTTFSVIEQEALNAQLPATTNKGQTIIYSTDADTTVRIVDNTAIIVNPGEVMITASQPGDGVNFNAAEPISKKFTITKDTLTLTDLSASAIIYGQALSSSTISGVATDTKGNTVDGTFTWADGTELLSVGTHVRTVVFTPSENVAWYIVGTTSASVQVVKADPDVTPQASDIEFGHYVKESTLSTASGTVAGTWYWHSNDKNDKLSVGTHTLYVDFVPQNDALYNSLTDVPVSLTVITATHYIFDGPSDNWDTPANWNTGMLPDKDKDVIINSNVTISEAIEVNSLTIEEGSNVTLIVNGQLTVGDGASEARSTYGDLYVKDSAKVILSAGGDLKVRNLFIEATLGNLTQPGSSGQISRKDVLTVNGDVYFKLSLEPNKAPVTKGWYDFVVPFEVDVIGGITIADAPTAQMVFNTNYAVMNYDEEKRATNGKSWNKFTGTMVPGKVYTIAIDYTKGWKTVLFKKKKGAAIDDNTSLATSYSNVGETIDRGWNGLGNSTLQHCQLNLAGISDDSKNNPKIQVYDHSNDLYVTLEASSYSCAIGTSFFVQVPQKVKSISLSAIEVQNRGGIFFAPAYEDKTINEFRLALTMEGKQIASDHLWVSASEAATGEYVIGQDLGKMGDLTSAKIARMWAKNNDMSLCDIEMPLVYGEASCALNIFAPEQATYTLSIEEAPEDAELYLTYNGKVVWNLTASPSQLVLKKGVKEGYGLLIKSAKESDRPEGFEDINTEDGVVRKVLIDNKIYIITPNGSMYDVAGKLVR